MKKSAFAQAAIFLLFIFCFVSMSNNHINNTSNYTEKDPNHKTIVYNTSKGLDVSKLSKNLKQLEVLDKDGRKVLSINKFNKTIYLNTLRNGAYLIKMVTKTEEIEYIKLVKY